MKTKNAWLLLLAAIVIAGCFKIARETPHKNQFVLEVTRPEGKSAHNSDAVLRVNEFRVAQQYEGREFKYRKGEFILESDFYNEFFVRPGEMIAEQVSRWLGKSGLFKDVVRGSTYIMEAYVLEGTVQDLYGDFRTGISEAVLELEFVLIKEGSSEGSVFKKQYGRRIPAPDGPAAVVRAWNQGLSEILSDFEKDLSSVLKSY